MINFNVNNFEEIIFRFELYERLNKKLKLTIIGFINTFLWNRWFYNTISY